MLPRHALQYQISFARAKLLDIDTALLGVRAPGKVDEMPAIGQKLRPAMGDLSAVRVQRGHWRGRTARRRDSHQWTLLRTERIQSCPTGSTSAISRYLPRIANGLHDPARDRDLLQLLVREESDELPIRRPERKICSFRPVEPLGGQRTSAGEPTGSSLDVLASRAMKARYRPSGEGTACGAFARDGLNRALGQGEHEARSNQVHRLGAEPPHGCGGCGTRQSSGCDQRQPSPADAIRVPGHGRARAARPSACAHRRFAAAAASDPCAGSAPAAAGCARGVSFGSAVQSGSAFTTDAIVSVTVSPPKSRRPVSIS